MAYEDDEPYRLAQLRLDVIERLAAWAGSLAPKTSEAYAQSLLRIAAELGEQAAPGIFIRLAVAPAFVHERLTAFAADGDGKSNTRRKHLAAVNSAHRALITSGIVLPELRVLMPERDVKLVSLAPPAHEIEEVARLLARAPGKREKRTAAAIALAAVALRAHEMIELRFANYAPGRIAFVGAFVDLPEDVDVAVRRWWDIAETECLRPFALTTRSLQRDVAELADAVAPSLTLEGVRRRAIIDAYLAGGAHAAASFARTSNASEVRRIVEADGQVWIPDHAAPAARGPAPGSVGTRRRTTRPRVS